MEKIWKDILAYEGLYQVSNTGVVRRLTAKIRRDTGNASGFSVRQGKILKPYKNLYGYINISLCKNGKEQKIGLHRLIAQAFIPNPKNKPCINHINGIKTDNRVENLEWVTYGENNKHAYCTGLIDVETKRGSNNGNSKYSKEVVLSVRKMYDIGNVTIKKVAEAHNIPNPTARAFIRKILWAHV